MFSRCSYCDGMLAAIKADNYCSLRSSDSSDFESNAFFFLKDDMCSGHHVSRFSVRCVSNGYQIYEIDGKYHCLNDRNFIIVNEGQTFASELRQDWKADGLIMALDGKMVQEYWESRQAWRGFHLDPSSIATGTMPIFENTLDRSESLDAYFQLIKAAITDGDKDPLFFQEKFVLLLDQLCELSTRTKLSMQSLPALKDSTREELYRRLSTARDYMEAHLDMNLSLRDICREACLSSFHFIRSFRALYGESPYQYLMRQRLSKAHLMVKRSKASIGEIMGQTGFNSSRTFRRAYQRKYGMTPLASRSVGDLLN